MALYLHFNDFRDYVLNRLGNEITILEKDGDPRLNQASALNLAPQAAL
jgi:hypothetical protein